MSLSVDQILMELRRTWPDATYELHWNTPEEMLIATILAAQSTDERINKVTPDLFAKYPTPETFAKADLAKLEEDLKPTGYYRQKAKTVQGVCQTLVRAHRGKVPPDMDALVKLPGVGRKTANVVLNCCFNIPSGIIVDTHVLRVSQRMGLTRSTDVERIESDLMRQVPKSEWTFFGPAMVLHGRYTCKAKAPECDRCPFASNCPKRDL